MDPVLDRCEGSSRVFLLKNSETRTLVLDVGELPGRRVGISVTGPFSGPVLACLGSSSGFAGNASLLVMCYIWDVAVESPRGWVPATHMGDLEFLTPGFDLAQLLLM